MPLESGKHEIVRRFWPRILAIEVYNSFKVGVNLPSKYVLTSESLNDPQTNLVASGDHQRARLSSNTSSSKTQSGMPL